MDRSLRRRASRTVTRRKHARGAGARAAAAAAHPDDDQGGRAGRRDDGEAGAAVRAGRHRHRRRQLAGSRTRSGAKQAWRATRAALRRHGRLGRRGGRAPRPVADAGRRRTRRGRRSSRRWMSIAAKSKHGPCVAWVGPDGAGHFVKMVHNGIEYADMQLIAEAYDVLARAVRLRRGADRRHLRRAGTRARSTRSCSSCRRASCACATTRPAAPLVDEVLDVAGQKGTGKWSAQIALDLGRADPDHQRGHRRAPALGAQGGARGGGAAVPGPAHKPRRRGAARGDAARALRGQALLVRAGHGAHRRRLARVPVERRTSRRWRASGPAAASSARACSRT